MDARMFEAGDRVVLVKMDDEYRDCSGFIGTEGTVLGSCPPPINVLNVEWDDGFSLNPCLDVDVVRKVGDVRGGREFYTVLTEDGQKWVKYQGFTWRRQNGSYACTTVDDCYIAINSGGSAMSNSHRMFELAERRRQYQEDMGEREFFRCNARFHGASGCGKMLHVDEVDPDTPDGDYWFPLED